MNAKNTPESLDDVLFRFHREVENPTAEIVTSWSRHYPEYASEIQAHAVELLDLNSRSDSVVPDIDNLEARARSVALNAVYEAKRRRASASAADTSLREAAKQKGIQLRDLADEIGLARSIMSDVASGAIDPRTINPKFVRRTAPRLGMDFGGLAAIIAMPTQVGIRPSVAFKAVGPPSPGRSRTWAEAIGASDMSDEAKSDWLSEDD